MKQYLYDEFSKLYNEMQGKTLEKKGFISQISIYEEHNSVSLSNELELFKKLFQLKSNKVLYHYTSFETLLYIIKSGKLKFSSVVGFNDADELRSKATILGDGLKHPYNKNRVNSINNRYVFCLSERRDDLNQWRLYGDDGKGICFGFKIDSSYSTNNNFYIGEVSYGDKIKKFLNRVTAEIFNKWGYHFDVHQSSKWGYFIKGQEWEDEREVRMLIISEKNRKEYSIDSWSLNSYGILYPSILIDLDQAGFLLSSITLGPKCPAPQLNKTQISILLKTCFKKWTSKPIKQSKVTSYR